MADRSSNLFQAVFARELAVEDLTLLLDEVVEPEVAFFLRNNYGSLALAQAGD